MPLQQHASQGSQNQAGVKGDQTAYPMAQGSAPCSEGMSCPFPALGVVAPQRVDLTKMLCKAFLQAEGGFQDNHDLARLKLLKVNTTILTADITVILLSHTTWTLQQDVQAAKRCRVPV